MTLQLKKFLPCARCMAKHGLDWIGKAWTKIIKHGLMKHGSTNRFSFAGSSFCPFIEDS